MDSLMEAYQGIFTGTRIAGAFEAAPPLLTVNVTEPMVSPFCKPLLVKFVLPLPKDTVCPYALLCPLAVMVKGAGDTTKFTVVVLGPP